ncbi:Choline/Carnitine o-acyltransferase-domain-containing protein [Hypoxylon argillaceum]|nr:Choline/Carnitine o-acyltransferase-domain-containing protein [Hypoxylon argillaceum]
MRAALLTVAAMEFADEQASDTLASDFTRGVGLRNNPQNWLFYATRRPELGVDRTLALGNTGVPLSLRAIKASCTTIIDSSDHAQPPVCTLTADERDSWALLRRNLELDPENAAALSAIDKAAFVVCLDDESPSTSGERLTQFLINGDHQPFANRWLDKPVQLAVTANGLSGGIHEHSKIDGLDVVPLHQHLIRELMSSKTSSSASSFETIAAATTLTSYPIRHLNWNRGQDTNQRIAHLETDFNSPSPYGFMGHNHVKVTSLGRAFLRGRGISPNAAAHLVLILALFLVDGIVRLAWEIVSLAGFTGGRIDWVQTVSPAVRVFVEAAAAAMEGDDKALTGDGSVQFQVRSLFREAARLHSKAVTLAAQGGGYVNHLYALCGIASGAADGDKDLPALFRTSAWEATRRGGIGWKEAGDRGVYVHCDVSENHASFFVLARTEYKAMVSKALVRAAAFISQLLAK